VTASPLWRLGAPGSLLYRLFDRLRDAVNHRLARYLVQRVAGTSASGLRTLEAGSGPGGCSAILSAAVQVKSATVLDLDVEALRLAARRRSRLQIVQGDLYALPFREGTFDLVFNSSTLEHVASFGDALAEMRRVTRLGGRLFVGVPYRRGPFLPFAFAPEAHPVSRWMGTLYSASRLRTACRRPGLRVEEIRTYFLDCFVGALMVKTP
jgi:ubiquinone/menaquinone biosynthesis C-methylase UbiE